MKHKLFFFLVFAPLLITAQAFRNFSNEFLNIGVDAAGLGMSRSVVATTNDVNAIYWNPAGLVGIKDTQGTLMHASYFAGIANFNHAAFAKPIDEKSAFGVSLIRFGVDDILNTTELIDSQGNINFNRISLFSSVDYAFNVAYAKQLAFKNLKFGANAKVIRRIIGDFASAWGVGFDAGLQLDYKSFKFGLMARDITTTFNTWSVNETEFNKIRDAIPGQNQELPETTELTRPSVQFGVAKNWDLGNKLNLLTELDANVRFTETNDILSSSSASLDPALGFQLDYDKIAYLRAGIGNFQTTTEFDNSESLSVQPNFGVGFKFKGIKIDYALTNIGSVGNALFSNVFSVLVDYSFFRK